MRADKLAGAKRVQEIQVNQPRRERQRERYKAIDLITEYNKLNNFTWECNQLATFPSSSLETERENLNFVVFR